LKIHLSGFKMMFKSNNKVTPFIRNLSIKDAILNSYDAQEYYLYIYRLQIEIRIFFLTVVQIKFSTYMGPRVIFIQIGFLTPSNWSAEHKI
jgi:hypothetical protein